MPIDKEEIKNGHSAVVYNSEYEQKPLSQHKKVRHESEQKSSTSKMKEELNFIRFFLCEFLCLYYVFRFLVASDS